MAQPSDHGASSEGSSDVAVQAHVKAAAKGGGAVATDPERDDDSSEALDAYAREESELPQPSGLRRNSSR